MDKVREHLDRIKDNHPECVVIIEIFIEFIERRPKINEVSKAHLSSKLIEILQSIAGDKDG